MQQVLLDHLRKITEEEQRILDGVAEVDKDLYTSGQDLPWTAPRCSARES